MLDVLLQTPNPWDSMTSYRDPGSRFEKNSVFPEGHVIVAFSEAAVWPRPPCGTGSFRRGKPPLAVTHCDRVVLPDVPAPWLRSRRVRSRFRPNETESMPSRVTWAFRLRSCRRNDRCCHRSVAFANGLRMKFSRNPIDASRRLTATRYSTALDSRSNT